MAANIIVTQGFRKFVSYLMKGGNPKLYFALGAGNPAWGENPPSPSNTISSLVNELFRIEVDPNKINYLELNSDKLVPNPTSRLQIECLLGNNQFYGVTREYGLFAIDASINPNSGTLIQYSNHPPISVSSEVDYYKQIIFNN